MPGPWSKKLPKGKAWSHHSDREDLAGLRAKLLTGLGHPLYCASVSLNQKLNKLKPPSKPVKLTGRLLPVSAVILPTYGGLHEIMHHFSGITASNHTVGWECTCSVLCRKTDPSLSHLQRFTASSGASPSWDVQPFKCWTSNSCCKVHSSTFYFMFFYTEKHSNFSYFYSTL